VSKEISLGWLLTILAVQLGAGLDFAKAQNVTEPGPTLRRIFVPQDGIESEARNLWPVKRVDFERRWAALQAVVRSDQGPPGASIVSGVYRAKLRGDALVDGTAELNLERQQGAENESTPVWLVLAPCNLAVSAPVWKPVGERNRAESVTWGHRETGELALSVPRSNVLRFAWSLRGRRDERGWLSFDLAVPAGPQQRLVLSIPATWKLTSESALVQEVAEEDRSAKSNESPAEVDWNVEIPPGGRTELRLEPRQREGELQPLVLVRETSSIVFSPGQIDLELCLELDIDRAPLRTIRVPYDARLEWTTIRWGEQSLAWITEQNANGEPVAVITLPEPLMGNSRLIHLTGVAEWSSGTQKWSLPRATVEGAIWQEGRINVAAPRWLQLDGQAGAGSRLTATTLASDSQGSDLLQFQLERSSAVVTVQAASAPALLDTTSLVTLQVEPKQLVAQVAAELAVASGSQFTIECEVARGWLLDSIDTVPADLLEDRFIRPRGNQQQVTLFLKQAIRSGKPLRLNARLRQVRGKDEENWNDDVLQPLRFPSAANQQRYVTLQLADASAEPRLSNASGLEFLTAATLPAQVRSLSEAPLGNWLVRLTDAARHPRFVLAHGTPRYVAETTLHIALSPAQADYHLQVHCQPESSAVSRVLLQIRPAPATNPLWFLAGESRPLAVERIPSPALANDQPEVALYRVELPGSRDTDFTVEARWSEVIAANTAAPLTDLPEATSHASLVEIAGPLDAPITWLAERLRPLPIPAGAAQLRARYRFQAGQDSRLTLLPLRESERSLAGWISRCDVASEFAPSGAARHEARFLLAGDDVAVLEVRLPEGSRLARAVVDGRDVLAYSRTSDPRWLSIPLSPPPGSPRTGPPLVRLEYISPALASQGWLSSRWTAPLLETRLPILQGQWQAHLPRGWRVWPEGERSQKDTTLSLIPWGTLASASDGTHVVRELTTATHLHVDVYSVSWLTVLALACGFIAGAVAWQLQKWPASRLLAGAMALLAASLLLSEPWRMFLQAALAGWLTGLAWLLLGQLTRSSPAQATPQSTRFILQTAARLLLLSGVFGSPLFLERLQPERSLACAADEPAKKDAWRVVTPLDAQGRPADIVYVSDALHTALFRKGDALAAGQPDWLLRSAQYDVRWQAGEAGGEFQGVIASLEVEVLREPSVLRLPFVRDQVRISEPGVRIDGEPASASWSTAGDALQIELTRAGRRRLEIGLTLAEIPKDGAAGALVQIPAIADSRVILPPLPASEQIKISSARGAEQQAAGAVWHVALGSANELRVQWSNNAAEPLPVVEAEQLLVWKLRPQTVVIDGKWQFRALSGKLREVVLRADPRYRLLPGSGNSPFVRQWNEEGDVNLHHFVLSAPASGDVTLTASFLLVGSTGVGSLTPPRLEPVADRLKRDWQAASLAPAMQWTGKSGTLPVADFLQAWGDSALAPVQAFRATSEAPRPTLSVVASLPRLQGEQRVQWSLAPDLASAEFRLSGALASPQVNQLRFQLPAQWNVRRVTFTQPTGAAALRWFRHADGILTLLLDEVRAEPWQIEIVADRSQIPGRQSTLPVLATSDLDISRYECVIHRRSGAEIKLGKIAGWTALPRSEDAPAAGRERIVGHYEWTSTRPGTTPPAIPLSMDAAPQAFTGNLLTRLRPVDAGFEVDIVASLQAPGKSFDELQFSVPRDWTDSLELVPPGTTRIESLPGQSRNLLRVQLEEPVKDKLTLTMTARLVEEPELIRLPVVDLVGQLPLRRWVALPATGMDSRLQWQTSGLQLRAELPTALAGADTAEESFYEATFERYRASARPVRARVERPRIVLADHQVAGLSDGRVVGRSELTILPGGARIILIQPPESHELVAAVVNDVPAQLRREPGISGAATVELHSDSWPQWVQVIYRGRLPTPDYQGDERQFAAPRVAGVPVERTRWHVISSEPLQDSTAHSSRASAGEDDLLAPLEALAKIAKGATDAPSGNSAETADLWLRLWRQRWDREHAVLSARPATSPLAPVLTARLRALETEMADLLTLPVAEASVVPVATVREGSLSSDAVTTHPQYELRHTQAGELATWTVALPENSSRDPERWNWLIATVLIVSAGGLTQFDRIGALRDWIAAYAQLALALAGCATLLIPGYLWLGSVLLALALLATLHAPWKR
jgi:hypothetical protein